MDAANPRRRWIARMGLLAVLAAGCKNSDPGGWYKNPEDIFRGQSPSESVPGSPLPPVGPAPTSTPGPSSSPTPTPTPSVQPAGSMAIPTKPDTAPGPNTATPASFVAPPSGAALQEFLLRDKPRVKVVAIVGKGNIITDDEVWQSVRQRPDHRSALISVDRDQIEAEMYRYELKKIVERELLVDDMIAKMKKNKPGAVEEIKEFAARAADRQIRAGRRSTGLATDKEFEDRALVPQGLSLNVLKRQIERNTIAMEYIRSLVREKAKGIGLGDVHEFYVKNPDKFQTKEKVKWQDIFIAFAKFQTPQEAYRYAEEVRAKAASGADFATLSKHHDHGDAAFRDGDGVGDKRGEIRPVELEPVIFQTQPGQVSGLVQVAAGYHIVKVVERSEAGTRPFDEKCQEAIRDMLFDQMQKVEYKRLTEDLWRKGAVQIVDVP